VSGELRMRSCRQCTPPSDPFRVTSEDFDLVDRQTPVQSLSKAHLASNQKAATANSPSAPVTSGSKTAPQRQQPPAPPRPLLPASSFFNKKETTVVKPGQSASRGDAFLNEIQSLDNSIRRAAHLYTIMAWVSIFVAVAQVRLASDPLTDEE
jgi:hypothetical protein